MKHQEHIISVFTSVVTPSDNLIANDDVTIESKDIVIMQRGFLETEPKFRQLIPYVIVRQGGKYLTYQRSTAGGESRLHNLYSMGIGGHVDAIDAVYDNKGVFQLQETLATGMYRELDEEMGLAKTDFTGMTTIGYLALDTNLVSQVHMGIVLVAELKPDVEVSSREDAINFIGFLPPAQLAELNLESWSAIVVAELAK